MSCSEVMYQAYYPYLYQRPGAAPPVSAHPVPRAGPFSSPFASAAHQYDRFTAQRLQDSHINQPSTSGVSSLSAAAAASEHAAAAAHVVHTHSSAAALYLQQGGASAGAAAGSVQPPPPQPPPSLAGSVSSTGGISPTSPHRGKEEDCSLHGRSSTEVTHHGAGGLDDSDSDDDTTSSRAQYVSANCVVFTHYQGDAASQVDEHFSRALDKATSQAKDISPMSARNFPASFWNSHYQGQSGLGAPGGSAAAAAAASSHHAAAELYGSAADHYHPGEWYHSYPATHHYHQHHHNMAAAAGYSGLLLPGSRLHVPAHAHAQCKAAVDWQHAPLDPPYPTAYPTMSGLEAQVQESSKDLYWF